MPIIPLLPAWTLSLGAGLYAYVLYRRYKTEKAPIMLGKIFTLSVVALIYFLIQVNFFDNILLDRSLSRISWFSFLITELSYHFAKLRWKL